MAGAPPPPQPPAGYPPAAGGGGYTLPPTVAYFPVTAYTNPAEAASKSEMMSQESLNNLHQPNTPDLLMHRRQVLLCFFEWYSILEAGRAGKKLVSSARLVSF